MITSKFIVLQCGLAGANKIPVGALKVKGDDRLRRARASGSVRAKAACRRHSRNWAAFFFSAPCQHHRPPCHPPNIPPHHVPACHCHSLFSPLIAASQRLCPPPQLTLARQFCRRKNCCWCVEQRITSHITGERHGDTESVSSGLQLLFQPTSPTIRTRCTLQHSLLCRAAAA